MLDLSCYQRGEGGRLVIRLTFVRIRLRLIRESVPKTVVFGMYELLRSPFFELAFLIPGKLYLTLMDEAL